MRGRDASAVGLAVIAGLLCAPAVASADTITVTTTADLSGIDCTLRSAIAAANTDATAGACTHSASTGADTINFNLSSLPATINLATTALPDITKDLTIAGPGAGQLDVHRTSAANFRILTANQPSDLPLSLTVSGLTLSNGNVVDSAGGGVSNVNADLTLDHVTVSGNHASVSANGANSGGGIFNNTAGTLHLNNSVVTQNGVTANAAGGGLAFGGGIYDEGEMTVSESTISSNSAAVTASGSGSANALGAGIEIDSNTGLSTTTIERSTVSDNTATATTTSGPAFSQGGGIDYFSGASLVLDLTTIGNNQVFATSSGSTDAQGGGIRLQSAGATLTGDTIAFNSGGASGNLASSAAQPGSPVVRDTIISNPVSGSNCSFPSAGSLTSQGYNLEDDPVASCLFEAAHDRSDTNPVLTGPAPADDGGPTLTYALGATSPAIEAGSAFGKATDQRGLLRPSDDTSIPTVAGSDGSDIGAFEVQGQPFPPPPVITPPATPPAKKCKKKKKHGHKASAAKKKCKKKKKRKRKK